MLKNDTWLIAYINRDFINIASEELKKYEEFEDLEVYIPTVKVLKKKAKGKDVFEELPLLFNYGFFKMPLEQATNPDFLMQMRYRITCIYAWVKDPSKAIHNRPNLNIENKSDNMAIPAAAIAKDEEITRMVKACNEMSIFDEDEIDNLEIGSFVKLEGYPFEGIDAKILDIDKKKKQVTVELQLDSVFKEVKVSFENVFYTVYKGFENKSREKSLEEMGDINLIDSLIFKNKNYRHEE